MAHVGSCFCGAVTLEVTGAPEAMGYINYAETVLPMRDGLPKLKMSRPSLAALARR